MVEKKRFKKVSEINFKGKYNDNIVFGIGLLYIIIFPFSVYLLIKYDNIIEWMILYFSPIILMWIYILIKSFNREVYYEEI